MAQDWSADGKTVLFAAEQARGRRRPTWRFYTVPAAGGPEEPLVLPRGYQGRFSPTASASPTA